MKKRGFKVFKVSRLILHDGVVQVELANIKEFHRFLKQVVREDFYFEAGDRVFFLDESGRLLFFALKGKGVNRHEGKAVI